VLGIKYPETISRAMATLKPLQDLYSLFFSSECAGFGGFIGHWFMCVVGVPSVLVLLVAVQYLIEVRSGYNAAYARGNFKSNILFVVFFCYTMVIFVCCQAFMCWNVGPDQSVLIADDTIKCEDEEHRLFQYLSELVLVIFGLGSIAVFGYILAQRARTYVSVEYSVIEIAMARKIAADFGIEFRQAANVVRHTTSDSDYKRVFVYMDAYRPELCWWEALDLLRKLVLLGFVAVMGRSFAHMSQIFTAVVVSVAFLGAHLRFWPYKLDQDNVLRTATEGHVFLMITSAAVLESLSDSSPNAAATRAHIDVFLSATFLLCVPVGFCVAIVDKVRMVQRLQKAVDQGPQQALDRFVIGLATEGDLVTLQRFFTDLRVTTATAEFTKTLEGREWTGGGDEPELSQLPADPDAAELDGPPSATAVCAATAGVVDIDQDVDSAPEVSDEFYSKFTDGFIGSFAHMSDYYGGLEKMIGECQKDLMKAMETEHCAVQAGDFGASTSDFTTSNYLVTTTPHDEWMFVVHPDKVEGDVNAGVDPNTGESRGVRTKIDASELHIGAAARITATFAERGWGICITDQQLAELPLLIEEVIALRLYTGPMFEIYNGVLRAWGNPSRRGFSPPHAKVMPGADVRGCFTTTLHVISSGTLKLSRLQPAMKLYRGISSMQLPKRLLEYNEYNVRGGVEYAFMSLTLDESVALEYAKGGNRRTASTLVEATMGMVDRGASLDWLSQYPHEQEVLLPPLTAMEVLDIADFESADDPDKSDNSGTFKIRRVKVRLSCNMLSATVEKLLGTRKKQVEELISIVQKDLARQVGTAADMTKRQQSVEALTGGVVAALPLRFIENGFMTQQISSVMELLPKLGDQIEVLQFHSGEVYGLVNTDTDGSFASCAWDGRVVYWTLSETQQYRRHGGSELQHSSQSLALACMGSSQLVTGRLDGSVTTCSLTQFEGSVELCTFPRTSRSGIAALAARSKSMLAAGTFDGAIEIWDTEQHTARMLCSIDESDGSEHQLTEHVGGASEKIVRALLWISDLEQDWLVSASFDKTITVWMIASADNFMRRHQNFMRSHQKFIDQDCAFCARHSIAHRGAVTVLALVGARGSERSPVIASGSQDCTIKLWDFRTGVALATIRHHSQAESSGVCSLAWIPQPMLDPESADNQKGWLVSGRGDNTIVAHDLRSKRVITTLRGHGGAVHALLWVESKGWLVSGSADNTVRTWRVRTRES
jgi:WD40 repeat protein